jgi:CYTH domain-containing protein
MLAGHSGNYARYEIEKKYLLKKLPDIMPDAFQDLSDLYLKESSLRLRIVKSSDGLVLSRNLTKKDKVDGRDPSISLMTSLYLSETDLASLGTLNGAIIAKRRYFQETETSRISIDIFKGAFEGLILAEVEFKTEEARDQFEAPKDWTDVTGNQKYSCGFLAFNPTVSENTC